MKVPYAGFEHDGQPVLFVHPSALTPELKAKAAHAGVNVMTSLACPPGQGRFCKKGLLRPPSPPTSPRHPHHYG